jgi:hypothetical protein
MNDPCEAEATSIYTRPEDGRIIALCATCGAAFEMGQSRATVDLNSLECWADNALWVIERAGVFWNAAWNAWDTDPGNASLFTDTSCYALPTGPDAGGHWITIEKALALTGDDDDDAPLYVIQKLKVFPGERPRFWSEDHAAFGDLAHADRFDDTDVDHVDLPAGGEWETLEKASEEADAYAYNDRWMLAGYAETPLAELLDPD